MCAYDGWIRSLEVHAWSAWFFPKLEGVAIYRKTILNLKQENLLMRLEGEEESNTCVLTKPTR
jgi:hypothetical protein